MINKVFLLMFIMKYMHSSLDLSPGKPVKWIQSLVSGFGEIISITIYNKSITRSMKIVSYFVGCINKSLDCHSHGLKSSTLP